MEDGREQQPVPSNDELLRLIFESATDFAIFTIDPNGITTSWNPGAERVLGYLDSEIIGQSTDVLFPPEEGGPDAAAEERRVARANGRAEDERWQVCKDGTRIWASGLLMPLADDSRGFVKILRDRTAQYRAEEQLRQSEQLFRALATNIPQLVFRSKVSGERTWPSPQWCVFVGQSFTDSMGLGWLEAIHADDRAATISAWQEAVGKGEYYVEHRIRSDSGEYRWHQTRAAPLGDPRDGSTEWVGTSTDIHDLRNLHDRQKVLLAELQHRTRNLLAVVQAIAQQTIGRSDSLEQFANAFKARLGALSRVQGLLASSDREWVDLHELVKTELAAYGPEKNKVVIEGDPVHLPTTAAESLALAIHELTTNAVKYGAFAQPQGRIQIKWRRDDGYVRMEWLESGIQMSPNQPARRGFGSELIERALPYQLGAETKLEFGPNGVRCEIAVPLRHIGNGPAR